MTTRQINHKIKMLEKYKNEMLTCRHKNETIWYYLGERVSMYTVQNIETEILLLNKQKQKK